MHARREELARREEEVEQACLRADSIAADLEAARGRLSEMEADASSRADDLRARDEQLNQAKQKLLQFAEALDTQKEQIEQAAATAAAMEERDHRIHELEGELSALHERAAAAQTAAMAAESNELESRDQRIRELEEQLESISRDANTAAAEPAVDPEEITKRDQAIEKLSGHIRRLQTELEQARCESASSAAASHDESRDDAAGGPCLERRRARLLAYKSILRARSDRMEQARESLLKKAERLREADQDRRTILQARDSLERAERRMIRKWARSRVVTQMFWLTALVLMLGSASYFGVMQFWPATYAASATVQAKPKPGFPLTDEQATAWQAAHEQMIMSDSLVSAVATRLRQRGYEDLADAGTLKSHLASNLSFAAPEPGTINFHLRGLGQADTQRILETYTVAFVSASNAERGRRTDGAGSKLTVPATADAVPVNDDRLEYAGFVFAGSLGFTFFLGTIGYARLRRVKSALDAEGDIFEPLTDEARWQEVTNGALNAGEHDLEG
ncbi:MAG: hypothetical protein ACF8PN_03270 [Phycisphaerales bacterium]